MESKLVSEETTQSQTKIKSWPISLFLILLYLIVAMSDNFKGIFVPSFKAEFMVNNTQIGFIMTASLLAYAVFQYVGGILIEKFGYKKVLMLGFILSALAILCLVNCLNFVMLIISMFLLNTGMAMFNISVNTLGPALPIASTAILMNAINGSYGAGNTVLQIISGKLLASGINWRSFFFFMLAVVVAMFIYLLFLKIPLQPVVKEGGKGSEVMKSPILYLFIAAAGFYLAAEYGIGNWFVNYMNESFSMTSDQSALYIALFFGCKTLGLMVGGFVADKIGYFRCILIYGVAATATSFLGVLLGQSGLIIFAIGDFAFSAIFPTIITTISLFFKDRASLATGLILMFGTLIAMVVSQLVGILNDAIGTQYAFYIVAISIMCCTFFSYLIGLKDKNKE